MWKILLNYPVTAVLNLSVATAKVNTSFEVMIKGSSHQSSYISPLQTFVCGWDWRDFSSLNDRTTLALIQRCGPE